ncbi:MAG: dynamin family protein [Bilophila wadsworthia]
MSSRPTSASMLSMLPQPIQPIPGDSFNDRILLLLAAVATTDDMLTYREYQLVQEAAQAIFGERALHAELQAKLHYALLNPPSDPADIARDMANQADAQKVSSTFVDTMLKALSRIGGQEERSTKGASLVNDIEWAFRKSRLERSAAGASAWLNVGKASRTLPQQPASCLPGRKSRAGSRPKQASSTPIWSVSPIASTASRDARRHGPARRAVYFPQDATPPAVQDRHRGERKRGKSSLINAIIGQELSPVRESTPETATVVEFKYAHAPDYSVRFLDSSQFARLEDYLENEQDNLLLTRKIEHIRKGVSDGTFIPGKLLSGITCWDDLSDYISLEGRRFVPASAWAAAGHAPGGRRARGHARPQ